MKLGTRETDLVYACLELLKLRGVAAWRCNTGVFVAPSGRRVRAGLPGMPDILGVLKPRGRLLAIEVKRPASPGRRAGVLSPSQEAFLAASRAAGAFALVIDDLGDLVVALDRLADDPDATP